MDKEPEPKDEREINLDFEMVDEAFLLKADDKLGIEKRILAVALLLEAETKEGNEDVDGVVAMGLVRILKEVARDVSQLRSQLRRVDRLEFPPD